MQHQQKQFEYMKVPNEQKHINTKCGNKKKQKIKTKQKKKGGSCPACIKFEQNGNPNGSLVELFFLFVCLFLVLFFQFECNLKH